MDLISNGYVQLILGIIFVGIFAPIIINALLLLLGGLSILMVLILILFRRLINILKGIKK